MADAVIVVRATSLPPVLRLAAAAAQLSDRLAEDIGAPVATAKVAGGPLQRTLRPGTITALVELQAALRAVGE